MSTALNLSALAAQGELKIPIARGVVSQGGSGTDYTGWSGVSSVFVEAKVEVREQSRGFATLTLTVEGSSNGSDWSTLETFTFGHGGIQTATVSAPDDHLRVSWAVGGHSEWQIIEVTAAPSIIDTGAGGGSLPDWWAVDSTPDAELVAFAGSGSFAQSDIESPVLVVEGYTHGWDGVAVGSPVLLVQDPAGHERVGVHLYTVEDPLSGEADTFFKLSVADGGDANAYGVIDIDLMRKGSTTGLPAFYIEMQTGSDTQGFFGIGAYAGDYGHKAMKVDWDTGLAQFQVNPDAGNACLLALTVDSKLGFFNAAPVVKPTGVAVTAAGIHAALVSLGLIAA